MADILQLESRGDLLGNLENYSNANILKYW